MENMVYIQAPEHPKFVIRERAGGVGRCLLGGMMNLVYRTKADTEKMGWRLLVRELWGLIR
jgi:hypothetical protein